MLEPLPPGRVSLLPLAALLAALWLLASLLAAPAGARSKGLSVDEPAAERSETSLALLEVKGRAGARAADAHDLLIAIDLSGSSLNHSGVDLDGDGRGGEPAPGVGQGTTPGYLAAAGRGINRDLDDSVLMAELAAAEALIQRLPLDLPDDRIRVGLVGFSNNARVLSPLSSDRERLLADLAELRQGYGAFLGSTNFPALLRRVRGTLRRRSGAARSLLLLSDGVPSISKPEALVRRAADAGRAGIRIYVFVLGTADEASIRGAWLMAEATGGTAYRLERPGDVIAHLGAIDLADLESVSIRNATTGTPARALRQLPNGSFDGFVELAPGDNRIRVEARLSDGRTPAVERWVHRRPGDEGDAGAMEEMLERLRVRSVEIELWSEMERVRAQRKRIEIRPERPDEAAEP